MIGLVYQKILLLFLNIDISVTIKVFDLRFSVSVLKIPLEGSLSHFFQFRS